MKQIFHNRVVQEAHPVEKSILPAFCKSNAYMPQCAVLSSPCIHLIQLHTGLHVVHSISIKFVISFSRVIFYSIKDLLMLIIQEVCFSPSLLCPDLSHIDTLPFNYSSSIQMYPKLNFSSLSAANTLCLPSHSSLHTSVSSLFCKSSTPEPPAANRSAEVPKKPPF